MSPNVTRLVEMNGLLRRGLPSPHEFLSVIRSGGQSGVDSGALDAARAAGVATTGWCPAGGWAEDRPSAPGLLVDYPELSETLSADPAQRTEWNVRDSDVTLILTGTGASSPGTALTERLAAGYDRPCLVVGAGGAQDAVTWLRGLRAAAGRALVLNVAGPRESEWAGAYATSTGLVHEIINAGQPR